ncbi:hypothetical protein ACVQK1_06875 [Edwardsiella tarda]
MVYQKVINKIYSFYFQLFYKGKIEATLRDFYLNNKVDVYDVNKNFYSKNRWKIPFYKNLISPPVMNKENYRSLGENKFQSIFFMFLPKYKMNTGGSTGVPYDFHVSLKAGFIDSLHQKYQHMKAGYRDKDKIYVFNGYMPSPEDIKLKIFWRRKGNGDALPFGSKEFSSHFFNEENISFILNELMKYPPDFIRSYPSVFCDFTKLIMKIGWVKPPFKLKGIQLTSEVTTPDQEDVITKYWGDVVYYQYGHSEAATIASKHKGEDYYIFSPYYGLVEILDDNDNPVQSGEIGRIVVTSYHNTVRPFIRYDTGDLAEFRCYRGDSVLVNNILGRQQDYLITKSGKEISVTGLIFGQHFYAFKNILKWQIINKTPGDIDIYIVKMNNFSSKDEAEIKDKLSYNNEFVVKINFVDEIQKTSRGKHKLVIR